MHTILFLNARRRNFLVKSIQNYITSSLNGKCRLIVCESDTYDPVQTVANFFFHIERNDEKIYTQELKEFIISQGVNSIVVWNDHDYELLFKMRSFLQNNNVFVYGPSESCFDTIYNKRNCAAFLKDNNIQVPETISEYHSKINYPFIIKPEKGSGSVNVYKVNSVIELDTYVKSINTPFLQEFIDGTHYTVDMFNSAYFSPEFAIPRIRLKVRNSESLIAQISLNKKISFICFNIGRLLEVIGPYNIQLIERQGSYYIHDINLRFSGSCDLSIAAGAPLHIWLVNHALKLENSFTVSIQDKMIMSKYYESCFF